MYILTNNFAIADSESVTKFFFNAIKEDTKNLTDLTSPFYTYLFLWIGVRIYRIINKLY